MERLGCTTLVIGECGHGYASARWEGPEWLGRTFPFQVKSILELMDEYLEQGRIQVDPTRFPRPSPSTIPAISCAMADSASPAPGAPQDGNPFPGNGPARRREFLLRRRGRPAGLSQFKERRLQAGGMKAQQIRESGARIVVAPCHNCVDQLMELNKEYQLKVQIKTVAELVADALVGKSPTGEP